MAQYLRPTATIAQGDWTLYGDSAAHACIDEVTADGGATYIRAFTNASDAAVVRLSPVENPIVNTGHTVRIRWKLDAGSGHRVDVKLEQIGGSTIFNDVPFFNFTGSDWTTTERALTTVEAALITDYTALKITLTPASWGADQGTITWLEMEVPDPTGRAGYIWMEGTNLRGFEENAIEDTYLHTRDVDDTPVNGATTVPVSSNWAFDHVAASDPHTGYRLESADHTHQSAGLQAGQLDHGLAMSSASLLDDDHTQYQLESAIPTTATSRTFHVNAFQYPDPISEWIPTITGAYLGSGLAAMVCWLPLNYLKVGDIITTYNLVGDMVVAGTSTLDCKLVQVNKADPITTTDVTNGAITQVTADGNFDSTANCDDTTVATDKQYLLQITGTTDVADEIYVIGAEITVTRLI